MIASSVCRRQQVPHGLDVVACLWFQQKFQQNLPLVSTIVLPLLKFAPGFNRSFGKNTSIHYKKSTNLIASECERNATSLWQASGWSRHHILETEVEVDSFHNSWKPTSPWIGYIAKIPQPSERSIGIVGSRWLTSLHCNSHFSPSHVRDRLCHDRSLDRRTAVIMERDITSNHTYTPQQSTHPGQSAKDKLSCSYGTTFCSSLDNMHWTALSYF